MGFNFIDGNHDYEIVKTDFELSTGLSKMD